MNSIHQNSKGCRKKIKNKQHLNKNNEKNVHGGDVPNNHKNEKEDEKIKQLKYLLKILIFIKIKIYIILIKQKKEMNTKAPIPI